MVPNCVTAVEYVRPVGQHTYAAPHVIRADDQKDYVVKFPPKDDHRSNYNEYLGANLARHFKLAVLDTTIVKLSLEFIESAQANFRETYVKPGYYFATPFRKTDYKEVVSGVIKRVDLERLSNQSDVPAIIAFDIFISNNDRHIQNLLIVDDSKFPKKLKCVLIDHGSAFGGIEWNYMENEPLPYMIRPPPWELVGISMQQFEKAAIKLCRLTKNEIDGCLNELPSEWRNYEYDVHVKNALSKREGDKILVEVARHVNAQTLQGLKEKD